MILWPEMTTTRCTYSIGRCRVLLGSRPVNTRFQFFLLWRTDSGEAALIISSGTGWNLARTSSPPRLRASASSRAALTRRWMKNGTPHMV
jgi:hypothetical protein